MLAKLATRLVPGEDVEVEFHLKYIDNRVLNTPPLAISQARSETNRMAELCLECFDDTLRFMRTRDTRMLEGLRKKEDLIDLLQKEIIDFLVAVSQRPISQEVSKEISSLMHMVNDLEKVGDYCENLWELGERKMEERVSFSQMAMDEFDDLAGHTRDFLAFVKAAMERKDVTMVKKPSSWKTALMIWKNGYALITSPALIPANVQSLRD